MTDVLIIIIFMSKQTVHCIGISIVNAHEALNL